MFDLNTLFEGATVVVEQDAKQIAKTVVDSSILLEGATVVEERARPKDEQHNRQATVGEGQKIASTPLKVPPLSSRDSNVNFIKERPQHRVIAELAAQGLKSVEIAATLGVSNGMVSQVIRQPQNKEFIADLIHENFALNKQVIEVLDANVLDALNTLGSVMRDEDAPKNARIAAANAILDRKYGKATQKVQYSKEQDMDSLTVAEIAQALPRNKN